MHEGPRRPRTPPARADARRPGRGRRGLAPRRLRPDGARPRGIGAGDRHRAHPCRPRARAVAPVRRGEAMGYDGRGVHAGAVPPRGRGADPPRPTARLVALGAGPLDDPRVVARHDPPGDRRARGPGGSAPALAAGLRPRHVHRREVVDRVDGRADADGARRRRRRRGLPREGPDRMAASRRPRGGGASAAPGRAAPEPRSDGHGMEGARVVPRRARWVAVRPQRQRWSDRVVGRPGGRRMGDAGGGPGCPSACSRMSVARHATRSAPRPPRSKGGSAKSA